MTWKVVVVLALLIVASIACLALGYESSAATFAGMAGGYLLRNNPPPGGNGSNRELPQ